MAQALEGVLEVVAQGRFHQAVRRMGPLIPP